MDEGGSRSTTTRGRGREASRAWPTSYHSTASSFVGQAEIPPPNASNSPPIISPGHCGTPPFFRPLLCLFKPSSALRWNSGKKSCTDRLIEAQYVTWWAESLGRAWRAMQVRRHWVLMWVMVCSLSPESLCALLVGTRLAVRIQDGHRVNSYRGKLRWV